MACSCPNSIPNPNYGNKALKGIKNTTSRMLRIPCGVCDECVRNKQMGIVQRFIMETRKNHVYMASLTYNNKMLPKYVVDDFRIPYADYTDLNSVIRKLRRDQLFPRPFRYLAVSELGNLHGRPHFHVLFLLPKFKSDDFNTCLSMERQMFDVLKDNWCRNIGGRKFPIWEPLHTYKRVVTRQGIKSNYDLHYVNPRFSANGEEDVAWYVMKYLLKPQERAKKLQQKLKLNLDPDKYLMCWKIIRPRMFKSLDFGLARESDISNYLRLNVEKMKRLVPYPAFVSPIDGKVYPLARFYKSKSSIYPMELADWFLLEYPVDDVEHNDKTLSEYFRDKERMDKIKNIVEGDLFDDSVLFT